MKYVFIDLGAYDGDSIKAFYGMDLPVPYTQFDIYAFEPNPLFAEPLAQLARENPRITLSKKAAYISSGLQDWGMDQSQTPMGSTLMRTKRNWDAAVKTTVECFDFSKWLKKFRGSYVIVKMDIEGAEYDVLEKMIADGTDDIPAKMMIEFHGRKLSDFKSERGERIVKELRCPWESWA